MGTQSGIAFTSITLFTPITPEGEEGGCNGVELVCFDSPPLRVSRMFTLLCIVVVFQFQLIKPEAERDGGV